MRIEFQNKAAFVDELELFGPDDYYRNVALASNGASLVTNPSMTQLRGDLKNANDGIYGTMTWKSRAPEGSKVKPWVEVHFKEPHEVSRFRSAAIGSTTSKQTIWRRCRLALFRRANLYDAVRWELEGGRKQPTGPKEPKSEAGDEGGVC